MYSTAYNLWTFTWFVHFELLFRLKGTEKIHTERFSKFHSNIYSILFEYWVERSYSCLLTHPLYFRKNESYATQTGEIVTRKTRMHKWGIPLACVVGIGVSLPAGTVATVNYGECAAWHVDGAQMSGTNFNMNLSFLIANFLVPACLFVFPFLALFMQVLTDRRLRVLQFLGEM